MRSVDVLLRDMIEAAARIAKYVDQGKERFDQEELIQTFIVHQIQIIGEAATRLTEEFKSQHAEIPWRLIVGMRNILVHVYFGVDLEQVWATASTDIPNLQLQLASALEKCINTSDSSPDE